jgi:hypothetical protein
MMSPHRKKALEDSIIAFGSITGTTLPKLLRGSLISCEGNFNCEDSVEFLFDTVTGIDYLIQDEIGLKGLAVRCQWGDSWNTFTIRSKRETGTRTEEEKRIQQIEGQYIYPFYTIHCYFDNTRHNELQSMAVIKTTDLYDQIKTNPKVQIQESNNIFKTLHWQHIPKHMIKVWTKINDK